MYDTYEIARINRKIGIKGVNVQAAKLMETHLNPIVRAGKRYVIIDEQKKAVKPPEFLKRISQLFPELKATGIQ